MSYYLVDRKNIPNDIYLFYPSNYKQNKQECPQVQKFVFENGLEYYIGYNNPIYEAYEVVKIIEQEYNIISQFESPDEYQQYYHNQMEWYMSYKDCEKIWNYYYYNKDLIVEFIK